jgi:hypothetical protein
MRLIPLLLLLFCGGCLRLRAQTDIPVITKEILPVKGIYRFDAFREGSVIFRNGIITAAKLNYNISLDEMHFVIESGDTLSVADPLTVSFINLNGSRFYYDKGFIQAIDTFHGIILGFKQILLAEQERKQAYGIVKPHEGVRTYSFFTGNGQKYQLGEDELIQVRSREFYFFGDAFGHFSKTKREFVLQYFPAQQATITAFIKQHHINFNSLDDLLELMQFCRGLQ